MGKRIVLILVGIVCLCLGLVVGAWQSVQLKSSKAGQLISSGASQLHLPKAGKDENSQFETYNYPTIQWIPFTLPDAKDAAVQLWTTFEPGPNNAPQGTMKYRLRLFKATNKDQREVQLLDASGFKIIQFNANDFHSYPESQDLVESRDSVPCTEDQYKKAHNYSVK